MSEHPTVAVPRALLEALVVDEPCWILDGGWCYSHGGFSLKPGEMCPQAELKYLLEETPALTPTEEQ